MPVNNLLISYSDFLDYRPISQNISKDKELEPYILQAQRLDLRPFLGAALYHDIIKNFPYPAVAVADPAVTNYTPLINGEEYTDCRGDLIEFLGLKPMIVLYAYARFIQNVSNKVTRIGVVRNTNTFSEGLTRSEINDMVQTAKSDALFYQREAFDYLQEKKTEYPLWENRGGLVANKSSVKLGKVEGIERYKSQGDERY